MQYRSLAGALLAALPLMVVAAPVSDHVNVAGGVDGIEGYGIEPFQWEASAFQDGPLMNLTGTLEQVHEQLVQINPNYDNDFGTPDTNGLEKRTDFSGSSYNCDTAKWGFPKTSGINAGINHLRRTNARPSNGPGPGNCGRVSCSDNSAIWWCNDSKQSKTLASFGSIADGARSLVTRCTRNRNAGTYTAGQVFHHSDWNVITRHNKC